jgi:hypothetical protein
MFSTFASFIVLAAALTTANANEYAKFYNGAHALFSLYRTYLQRTPPEDGSCSVGGGIGVSINNPGCLSEGGRGSVYIPNVNDPAKTYCLVVTRADGSCSCQSSHFQFTATGFCFPLNSADQSYRFIGVRGY